MTRADDARRALALVDLTSLNEDDTSERIAALCEQAVTPAGRVAAVCVYGPFVRQCAEALQGTGVRVATVANFPAGTTGAGAVRAEVERGLADGADEVDVVLPPDGGLEPIEAARAASSGAVLKVILETGRLGDPGAIRAAADACLALGADFLKTSTGKLAPGATPAAARPMLEAIRAAGHGGFKASGGVRTVADAGAYLALADDLLGADWAAPATFRLGASGLLDDLLDALGAA